MLDIQACRTPLTDVHTHFLPATLVAALERRDELPRITEAGGVRHIEYGDGSGHRLLPAMGDLGARMRDMDAAGIDHAVMSVNVPGVDWFPAADGVAVARDVNDEMAERAATDPERLSALAVLPMQAPDAAAEELARARAIGLHGAMIYSNVAGLHLDEPAFRVVFEAAAELDLPLSIHPTYPLSAKSVDAYALIPTLGFLFDTTTAAMRLILGGVYDRHPGLKLVLSHAGSLIPYLVGRIDYEAARMPGGLGALSVAPSEHIRLLYTDAVCAWPPALRLVTELLGPDRVMFGTDYPFWDPERTVAALEEADLGAAHSRAIASETAQRLFGPADRTPTQGGTQ